MTEELNLKAEEYAEHINLETEWQNPRMTIEEAYIAGAIENGIQWHEIESKVSPKREISKQYMPKNKEKVLLKYHFSGEDEIHISDGYYDAYDFEFHITNNPKHRIVCVIAWSEVLLLRSKTMTEEQKKCKYCKGRGLIQISEYKKGLQECPYCNGTGVANDTSR